MRFTTLSLLGLSLLLATASYAQSTYADILGSVEDASGAVVPEARVTVTSLDTNATWETTTGTEGLFRVRQLPIGNYRVTVEKEGFPRYIQGPIVLRLNQNANLTVRLEISGVAEVVSVVGDATMVNTTNAEGFRKLRIQTSLRAAAQREPQRFEPGTASPWRQPVIVRADLLCLGRRELRGQRYARTIEQLYDRRSGLQRPQRHGQSADH
jgi:hypothetical protein